ncbi:hypothetical protein NU219Hw_g5624t1 [Hortaea werneckii]
MSSNTVRASTGYYTGQVNGEYPNVKEWLSIPYGQDTSGSGRFCPPKAVPLSSEHYDVKAYPPACPQYVSAIPTIWNRQIPQYLQYWGAENNSAGVSAPFASEDCLKLAVWTPANATEDSNLPVAMFWTGGGFQTNGILVPGQLPPRWVSRTQSHIVVTINYRMSILNFSNAFGVEDQNLGLLDMRVASEWVRDNIRYFGGDPSKIMIWGQSAGASAVDYHHYAFWEYAIAHAFFAQSGNVLYSGGSEDWDHTNFTFVAKYAAFVSSGVSQWLGKLTLITGNWTNQDPLPWMGAFHSSELVMLFGSYAVGQGPPKEELEGVTSRVMEGYLLAFIKDPDNGPSSMGWVSFNASAENQGTMLRFGANRKAVQNFSASDVEAVCSGSGPYNPFP